MHPPAVEEDARQCAFSLTKFLNIWLKTAMYLLETQPTLLSPGPSEGISTFCINERILPNSRTIMRDLRIHWLWFTQ